MGWGTAHTWWRHTCTKYSGIENRSFKNLKKNEGSRGVPSTWETETREAVNVQGQLERDLVQGWGGDRKRECTSKRENEHIIEKNPTETKHNTEWEGRSGLAPSTLVYLYWTGLNYAFMR